MADSPYTVIQTARVTGWSTSTIYGLIHSGELDLIPEDLGQGKVIRVTAASVRALMDRGKGEK